MPQALIHLQLVAPVGSLPLAVLLGHLPPRRSRPRYPQDATQDGAVVALSGPPPGGEHKALALHQQGVGRVYLRLEDLARLDYTEEDLGASIVDERFVGLVRFEIGRTRRLYAFADEGMGYITASKTLFGDRRASCTR